jgi:hypothetical protein
VHGQDQRVMVSQVSASIGHINGAISMELSYTRRDVPLLVGCLAALAAGCTPGASPRSSTSVYVRHLPPTATDVMEAVIRNHAIDNTVDSSCDNFGHWFDQTMGRQFAYLIEGLEQGKRGWVEIRTAPRRAPSGLYWRAMVMFHIDLDGPDPFNFGADFLICQSDGLVIASSFKCPGL